MDTRQTCLYTQIKVLSTGSLPLPLQAPIDKIAQKEGYVTHKVLNRAISTNGGNYLGILYEVDIKGKTAKGDKETNLFIKTKTDDLHSNVISVESCYNTENFFYKELANIYDDLQNKANIPTAERYAIVKSYDAKNPNAIILENLAKRGFTTVHRMEVVPLKFAEISIQQLARFHGLAWVLEKQYPEEYYTKKIRKLETAFKFDDNYQSFINNMSNYTAKCVDDNKRLKLDKFRSRMRQIAEKYYCKSPGDKCCLCHGDYRANNLLVKKEGDNISDIVPVDFQLMYYECPIIDLLYFIFPCTNQEFRKKHLNDLKDLYHESLTKFLKYFNMDVESVYPRCEFEAEFKEKLDFGLVISLIILPLLFTSDDNVLDFTREDMTTTTVSPDKRMDERVRGLIDEFENWGVL